MKVLMNPAPVMKRRAFLKTSTMLVLAVSAPIVISCDKRDNDPEPSTSCLTTKDILGPYYKADAPERVNIVPAGNGTSPLIIQGKVISSCKEFVEGAKVEIWNADEAGAYDMSENFLFRGTVTTGADGAYMFRTIIPGRYLNGSTYRPSHIHFKITAPGHNDLVSQVYFAGDPFIDDDPWASDPAAEERILMITKNEDNVDTVNFDIHLSIAD